MSPGVLTAALVAVILWSAGPVATKIAVADLPVLAVAAGRIFFGGIVALPLALALRIPLPRQPRQIAGLILSSLAGFVAFPILFCIGMTMTNATHGAMILALLPVITGLIANIWDRKVPPGLWWLGCVVAVAGEAILLKPGMSVSDIGGDVLVLCSAFFLALGYVSGGRLANSGYPAQGATYWGVALASILLAPLLLYALTDIGIASIGWAAWTSLAYLALGVTVAGYVLWYWALSRGGIAKTGLLQFLQPVSGVGLAHLLLNEQISLKLILAAVFVIAGVVIAAQPRAATAVQA